MPSARFRSASTLSHSFRISAASCGSNVLPSSWGRAVSNRSNWRRVRAIKARPSAMVIACSGSEKLITFDDGIRLSESSRLSVVLGKTDHAKTECFSQEDSAKLKSRWGRSCDICVPGSLRFGHSERWCIVPILHTKSGKQISGDFSAELCSGDLSIRITCSMGCGVLIYATATY